MRVWSCSCRLGSPHQLIFLAKRGTHLGSSDTGERSVQFKLAKSACTSGMHCSLRNTLVVKVRDLFAVVKVCLVSIRPHR